jgi:hypothetical protein
VAADDEAAYSLAAEFHEQIGFDVVRTGSLADSWRFERAKPAYCIPLDREGLIAGLAAAERDANCHITRGSTARQAPAQRDPACLATTTADRYMGSRPK